MSRGLTSGVRRIVLLLGLGMLAGFAQQSEWDYLPDHAGKASAAIELPQSASYKLSAAEKAAVVSSLTRLRDRLLAQPSLNPPRGVEVRGAIGSHSGHPESLNPQAGLLKEPVQAFGTLYYCFYYRDKKDGKARYNPFSTWELRIAVNNPAQLEFGPERVRSGSEFEKILREPRKVAEVQGFPVYRNDDNGDEFIVISRTGKPYWRPVTREEYVNQWIKSIEAPIAKSGPIPELLDVLRRFREFLARMSPAERQAQARHAVYSDRSGPPPNISPYDPPLAPMGSTQGPLLIAVNPEWYDPSLPRTAFQLITVRCLYRGDLDPDKPAPTETGFVSALRLWETLHKSDWKAISSVLNP